MANLFELPRYIAVEGPIRVGKSTLAGILAERLNAQRVMEPELNPFLGAFYEGERALSEEYLEEVVKAYEHFFFHYTSSDLLIVNTSDIDFVDRNEDLQELLRKVTEPIKGTQYFLPLGGQEAASA